MATRYPDIPQEVDPIEVHINYFFDRVAACVEYRRRTLLTEATDKRVEIAEIVAARTLKEEKLNSRKSEVEHDINNNEFREFQEQVLADIEAKLSELRQSYSETCPVFQGEFEPLEQLILNLGKVLEKELPVAPRYKDMKKLVEVGKNGNKWTVNPVELSNPIAVDIDNDSKQIYVTEWNPARVSIFSDSGELLNNFTHDRMKHPHGIAIHRNNVYVSDIGAHGVFHFKIESDISLNTALVGMGSDDGKFNFPQQLAVSDKRDLFVADCFNHRIQILDESLHFQRSIEHDSMQFPRDVKLTNNEVIVLTGSSPCVIVFSHAGEKLRSFISRGQGMQVIDPSFFCLDDKNNLIISDWGGKSVKIFSPDADPIYTMDDVTRAPYTLHGIALTKQKKLVIITPGEPFQLQIYA